MSEFAVRAATPADAPALVAILTAIAAEGRYTAITTPWPVAEQRDYIARLSPREVIHVAQAGGEIAGYQPVELWAPTLASMSHVAQIGTFVKPEWRRHGVGQALYRSTVEFARRHEIAKFVIQVRESNTSARRFYEGVGFRVCGRLARQVRIGGVEEDEILMEALL
jgi:ribosomal protein S18 acetylase RimI-like enzyme